MPTSNPSVKDFMKILLDRHAALLAKLDTTTDPKLGSAILAEAQEVLHRINLTQNLLFVATRQELTDAILAVKDADVKLKEDLASISDTAKFLNSAAAFLGYVDKAIDIAKLVAIV